MFNKIVLCFLFYLSSSCILCMHGGVQHILCFICLPLVSCVCMVVSSTYCVLFVFLLYLVYAWWCPTHIVFSLSSSCILCMHGGVQHILCFICLPLVSCVCMVVSNTYCVLFVFLLYLVYAWWCPTHIVFYLSSSCILCMHGGVQHILCFLCLPLVSCVCMVVSNTYCVLFVFLLYLVYAWWCPTHIVFYLSSSCILCMHGGVQHILCFICLPLVSCVCMVVSNTYCVLFVFLLYLVYAWWCPTHIVFYLSSSCILCMHGGVQHILCFICLPLVSCVCMVVSNTYCVLFVFLLYLVYAWWCPTHIVFYLSSSCILCMHGGVQHILCFICLPLVSCVCMVVSSTYCVLFVFLLYLVYAWWCPTHIVFYLSSSCILCMHGGVQHILCFICLPLVSCVCMVVSSTYCVFFVFLLYLVYAWWCPTHIVFYLSSSCILCMHGGVQHILCFICLPLVSCVCMVVSNTYCVLFVFLLYLVYAWWCPTHIVFYLSSSCILCMHGGAQHILCFICLPLVSCVCMVVSNTYCVLFVFLLYLVYAWWCPTHIVFYLSSSCILCMHGGVQHILCFICLPLVSCVCMVVSNTYCVLFVFLLYLVYAWWCPTHIVFYLSSSCILCMHGGVQHILCFICLPLVSCVCMVVSSTYCVLFVFLLYLVYAWWCPTHIVFYLSSSCILCMHGGVQHILCFICLPLVSCVCMVVSNTYCVLFVFLLYLVYAWWCPAHIVFYLSSSCILCMHGGVQHILCFICLPLVSCVCMVVSNTYCVLFVFLLYLVYAWWCPAHIVFYLSSSCILCMHGGVQHILCFICLPLVSCVCMVVSNTYYVLFVFVLYLVYAWWCPTHIVFYLSSSCILCMHGGVQHILCFICLPLVSCVCMVVSNTYCVLFVFLLYLVYAWWCPTHIVFYLSSSCILCMHGGVQHILCFICLPLVSCVCMVVSSTYCVLFCLPLVSCVCMVVSSTYCVLFVFLLYLVYAWWCPTHIVFYLSSSCILCMHGGVQHILCFICLPLVSCVCMVVSNTYCVLFVFVLYLVYAWWCPTHIVFYLSSSCILCMHGGVQHILCFICLPLVSCVCMVVSNTYCVFFVFLLYLVYAWWCPTHIVFYLSSSCILCMHGGVQHILCFICLPLVSCVCMVVSNTYCVLFVFLLYLVYAWWCPTHIVFYLSSSCILCMHGGVQHILCFLCLPLVSCVCMVVSNTYCVLFVFLLYLVYAWWCPTHIVFSLSSSCILCMHGGVQHILCFRCLRLVSCVCMVVSNTYCVLFVFLLYLVYAWWCPAHIVFYLSSSCILCMHGGVQHILCFICLPLVSCVCMVVSNTYCVLFVFLLYLVYAWWCPTHIVFSLSSSCILCMHGGVQHILCFICLPLVSCVCMVVSNTYCVLFVFLLYLVYAWWCPTHIVFSLSSSCILCMHGGVQHILCFICLPLVSCVCMVVSSTYCVLFVFLLYLVYAWWCPTHIVFYLSSSCILCMHGGVQHILCFICLPLVSCVCMVVSNTYCVFFVFLLYLVYAWWCPTHIVFYLSSSCILCMHGGVQHILCFICLPLVSCVCMVVSNTYCVFFVFLLYLVYAWWCPTHIVFSLSSSCILCMHGGVQHILCFICLPLVSCVCMVVSNTYCVLFVFLLYLVYAWWCPTHIVFYLSSSCILCMHGGVQHILCFICLPLVSCVCMVVSNTYCVFFVFVLCLVYAWWCPTHIVFYLSSSCVLCMHGGVQHILCFICLPLVSCVCMVVSNTYCVLFVFLLYLVYAWWCPTHIVFSLSSSCVLCMHGGVQHILCFICLPLVSCVCMVVSNTYCVLFVFLLYLVYAWWCPTHIVFSLSSSCVLCMHGGVQHILCFLCLRLVSCVCMVVSNTYCVLFVFVLYLVYAWWCPTHIVFSLSSSCVLCTQCCQFLRIVHS